MKKLLLIAFMTILALGLQTASGEEQKDPMTYTFEEMIAWAAQDEVNAEAAYQVILDAFGADTRPFSNIVKAERNHQALVAPLVEEYGVSQPQPPSITAPATLLEAMNMGILAEEENIAMYQIFLTREDLPDALRVVFERLEAGSQNHLAAFTRGADRLSGGGRRAPSRNPGGK